MRTRFGDMFWCWVSLCLRFSDRGTAEPSQANSGPLIRKWRREISISTRDSEMMCKEEPEWKKKTLKRVEVVANRLAVQ